MFSSSAMIEQMERATNFPRFRNPLAVYEINDDIAENLDRGQTCRFQSDVLRRRR